MKAQIVISVIGLIVFAQASASSFDVSCSDPEGVIQTFSGHHKNEAVLTERSYSSDHPKVTDKKVVVSLGKLGRESLQRQDLRSERRSECETDPTAEVGIYTSLVIYYERAKLTKADGSLFPKDTVGASSDRKSITADFICEQFVTGHMPCETSKQ